MKKAWNRREVVGTVGAGLFLGATPGWAFALAPRRRRARTLEWLADEILAAPRDRVFDVVEPLLQEGLPWADLQGTLFLAGIRGVSPRPVGNKLHSVLAIESVYQLIAASPPGEEGMAVLWNLDAIKESQARSVRQGKWELPPRSDVTFASKAAATRELLAAFGAHDAERADRAVAGLAAYVGRAELLEALWPIALREHVGLCHRTIFAVHVDRILPRVGDDLLEPAARSLVHGLLEAPPGSTVMHYAASSRMAQKIRSGWLEGEHDEGRSLAIARELRTATPKAAQASVVAELNAGRHPAVLWDALRLAAADLFLRSPGLLAVHATTVTNALYHVHRSSRNDEMRRIALLQAAAWITLFRDRFVRSLDTSMKGPGLDAVLEEEGGESAEALAAAHRAHLFRSVDDPHQPKYAAAVLEDARLAHPRWRRALLRPALDYLAGSNTPQTDLCQRSRELIERLER